jgi:uncharacterized protein YraI
VALACALALVSIAAAACTSTPTTPATVRTGPRHDGGITLGSGNIVDPEQRTAADSAARGGITLGSGN